MFRFISPASNSGGGQRVEKRLKGLREVGSVRLTSQQGECVETILGMSRLSCQLELDRQH